jgi:hypothetical protein
MYIIPRGHWCDISVFNGLAPSKNKTDAGQLLQELDRVFYNFPKYNIKMLLGDLNAKVGTEEISKPAVGNENLHKIRNDNGVRVINFDTSKNLIVKCTVFPHRNIHKFTWTSPDEKTQIQFDTILVDRRRHSSVLDVQYFRGAGCDTTTIKW